MDTEVKTVTLTPEQAEDASVVLTWARLFIRDNPGRDDDGDMAKIDTLSKVLGLGHVD